MKKFVFQGMPVYITTAVPPGEFGLWPQGRIIMVDEREYARRLQRWCREHLSPEMAVTPIQGVP